MNIAQNLERSARQHTARTALVFKGRRWTYAELDSASSRVASGLKSLGLKPGDRIGVHLPNSPEFVLTYYAASKIGVVPIALNVTYATEELAYIIADGEAAAVVTAQSTMKDSRISMAISAFDRLRFQTSFIRWRVIATLPSGRRQDAVETCARRDKHLTAGRRRWREQAHRERRGSSR